MTGVETSELARISVRGVVQGVGFRPFVYQLAAKYDLKGWVCNTSGDVKIEVEGASACLRRFLFELQNNSPPQARIEKIAVSYHQKRNFTGFEIRQSLSQAGKYQLISPDITTCGECLREVFDITDRRSRYPFTNCTNCGPRFTIIEDIPYDRPNTTMRLFRMCRACQAEYDSPQDRRFHAQPNACPACGPRLELRNSKGVRLETLDVIAHAGQLLKNGKILAVRGLGGFLLACDATNERSVQVLRLRKRRPGKPFAVMLTGIEEARWHCLISEPEEKLLASPQCPIVLLRWKPESSLSPAVAPNLKYLGVMFPVTPLHHLLLREAGRPLVMTSGNLSEEPICQDNDEALRRLSGLADYFLIHNREISARYDDSVAFIEGGAPGLIRRARGYAPQPVPLNFLARPVLGCGAQEKNTFCLTKENHAFISQHIGDMENLETMEHFESTLTLYKRLFNINPEILAHDLHPEYLSVKYARKQGAKFPHLKLVPIQHHHAHIVSCMVDNMVESQVIGVALDGTGWGSDGHIWGGEFLVADYRGFQRLGHLEYLPLAGGAAAIKKPYRAAIGYLLKLLGDRVLNAKLPFLQGVNPKEIEIIKHQSERNLNSPLCSSMGRLFDVVAALTGVRAEIDYEGQAAIELEMKAYDDDGRAAGICYPYAIFEREGVNIVGLRELLAAIASDASCGVPTAEIAARFHNTIAQMICDMCRLLAARTGIVQVALSGGVFQNRLLLNKVIPMLKACGFSALTHRQVPGNDGGISLGQAVIANFSSFKK